MTNDEQEKKLNRYISLESAVRMAGTLTQKLLLVQLQKNYIFFIIKLYFLGQKIIFFDKKKKINQVYRFLLHEIQHSVPGSLDTKRTHIRNVPSRNDPSRNVPEQYGRQHFPYKILKQTKVNFLLTGKLYF
jgi:hypothetical protein